MLKKLLGQLYPWKRIGFKVSLLTGTKTDQVNRFPGKTGIQLFISITTNCSHEIGMHIPSLCKERKTKRVTSKREKSLNKTHFIFYSQTFQIVISP